MFNPFRDTKKPDLMWNPVFSLLRTATVKQLLPKNKKLIKLQTTQTIKQALNILSENKIHSAPLFDEKQLYLGMLDNLTILRYVYMLSFKRAIRMNQTLKNVHLCQDVCEGATLAEVWDLLYLGGTKSTYKAMSEDDAVSKAARLFAHGYSRVAVRDGEGLVIGVLSQSDVLQFLYKHLNDKSLHMLDHFFIGMNKKDVDLVSIQSGATLSQTLQLMFKTAASCVAVTCESTGKLLGHFSASDLEKAFGGKWPANDITIIKFLEKYSPDSLRPIVMFGDTSLKDIITEMAQSHVRHIWGINELMQPRLCFALSDLFLKLSNFRLWREGSTYFRTMTRMDLPGTLKNIGRLAVQTPSLAPPTATVARSTTLYPSQVEINRVEKEALLKKKRKEESRFKYLSKQIGWRTRDTPSTFIVTLLLPEIVQEDDVVLKYENNTLYAKVVLSENGNLLGVENRELLMPPKLVFDDLDATLSENKLEIRIPKNGDWISV